MGRHMELFLVSVFLVRDGERVKRRRQKGGGKREENYLGLWCLGFSLENDI